MINSKLTREGMRVLGDFVGVYIGGNYQRFHKIVHLQNC